MVVVITQVKVFLNLIHIQQINCLQQKVKRNYKSCKFVCHCLFALLQQNNWNKLLSWTRCSGLCAGINKLLKVCWAALGPALVYEQVGFIFENGNSLFIVANSENSQNLGSVTNEGQFSHNKKICLKQCGLSIQENKCL